MDCPQTLTICMNCVRDMPYWSPYIPEFGKIYNFGVPHPTATSVGVKFGMEKTENQNVKKTQWENSKSDCTY